MSVSEIAERVGYDNPLYFSGFLRKPLVYHQPNTEIKSSGADDSAPLLSIQSLLKIKKIFSIVNAEVFGKLLHF